MVPLGIGHTDERDRSRDRRQACEPFALEPDGLDDAHRERVLGEAEYRLTKRDRLELHCVGVGATGEVEHTQWCALLGEGAEAPGADWHPPLAQSRVDELETVVPTDEVIGLIRPHAHLRVTGVRDHLIAGRLQREDVIGQQPVFVLHQARDQRRLPPLVGGEEADGVLVYDDRCRMQHRHAPQFEPNRHHVADEVQLDHVVVDGVDDVAVDVVGTEVELGHARETHHRVRSPLVDVEPTRAVVDERRTRVSGTIGVPARSERRSVDVAEAQIGARAALGDAVHEPVSGREADSEQRPRPLHLDARWPGPALADHVVPVTGSRSPAATSCPRNPRRSARTTSVSTS
jgi:hypothetical protein